ncbi:MAG: hypothetical protein JXL81_02620, partial [Deltaproteobacteria bacterium]|nr:hypothetical protein [Deltaproteobacteria bacterium]
MKYILIMLFFLVMIGCDSRSNKQEKSEDQKIDFIEYCKSHECRKDLKFRLRTPDDTYFEYSAKLSAPVVQERIDEPDSGGKRKRYLVTVFPGETIYIAFDPGKTGPENLRPVAGSDNSINTLTFKLSQEEDIADGLGMKLYIHNSSGFKIRY